MSESIDPHIPPHLLPTVSATADDDADEDAYMPALPPDLATGVPAPWTAAPRRVYGPALPTTRSSSREREERRRKNVEEARKPKKLQREEWMLVPPKKGALGPTKLKARQFGRSSGPGHDADSSLWTETPAERLQRLTDEVSGRKRKAVNAEPEEDLEDAKKRKKRDEVIRRGVEEHTCKSRGAALVDTHMEREVQKKVDVDEEPAAIWDHSRDMSVGGRLMDEKQRKQMLREVRGLGDGFGTGKSGGFL
ncbi:hypothetical protein BKA83DRAFT_4277620 [Pisolithus microcarpus]|nr:hypothetical protein BKA83DRAFT_4277620 [Pisolithus microcarpus]